MENIFSEMFHFVNFSVSCKNEPQTTFAVLFLKVHENRANLMPPSHLPRNVCSILNQMSKMANVSLRCRVGKYMETQIFSFFKLVRKDPGDCPFAVNVLITGYTEEGELHSNEVAFPLIYSCLLE